MTKTIEFQLGGSIRISTDEPNLAGVMVTLTYERFSVTAWGDEMSYMLPDDKQVKAQVSYVDSKGHAAKVDGDVTWGTSDDTIATLAIDPTDSSIVTISPGENLGQAQITATADADLGAGVTTLITTMDIEIVAGQAIAGTISPVGEATPTP
jgi:hypothetical protein